MVYEQIKRRAEEKGITVAEVARRAGVDPTLIGKWRKSSPSLDNAKRVADVLSCSVDELISETSDAAEETGAAMPAC